MARSTRASRPSRRVLLVEDEESVAAEIIQFLRRSGHEVMSCASVRAARDTLEAAIAGARPPQVVLSDHGLPDGDAGDLYVEFAARLPGCRWIVLSGHVDHEDLQAKIDRTSGPKPFVVEKPASLLTLRRLVEGDKDD